jgi:2-amino-4-hydroxy-6-hydroxymethyldihydropteridine diphosphokinase
MYEENIFLQLGSNLGDRFKNMTQALTMLTSELGMIQARSKIYETAPWGKTDQPEFLNQVIQKLKKKWAAFGKHNGVLA